MTLVVDANVAVHWTIETPLSAKAEALIVNRVPLIAPDLLISEVTNAFLLHAREHPDRLDRLMDGLEFLPRWFAELVPSVMLRRRTFALARELTHPAYDCFYLALAESRDTHMVTADRRFARKIASTVHSRRIVHLDDWRPD